MSDASDVHQQAQPLLVEPVELGRNVLVGANAIILRGASAYVGDLLNVTSIRRGFAGHGLPL